MMQFRKRSEAKLLLKKIDKISELLNQLKQALIQEVESSPRKSGRNQSTKTPLLASTEQLQDEYEQLLPKFASQGPCVVEEFVSKHTSRYLGSFIKANSLPISTKSSKKAIEDDLRNQLARSLAVRGK